MFSLTDRLLWDSLANWQYSLLDQFISCGLALSLDKLFKLRRQEGEAGGEKVLQSNKSQRWEAETRFYFIYFTFYFIFLHIKKYIILITDMICTQNHSHIYKHTFTNKSSDTHESKTNKSLCRRRRKLKAYTKTPHKKAKSLNASNNTLLYYLFSQTSCSRTIIWLTVNRCWLCHVWASL